MKSFFAILGSIIGITLIVYFIWILFIPMTVANKIGGTIVDRKVTENSLQYVMTQRASLVKFYDGYTKTDSEARKTAIKGQMCEIMVNIPAEEIPNYIKGAIVCR